jgi:mannose-1-phosphate guanylyltransferase
VLETLTKDPNPYNTTAEQSWIDAVYPETQKISIDYAVMEKATNVFTIPADIGWSDLGTWQSLHAYLGGESDAVTVGSNIHLSSCHDVLVFSDNPKTVVIKGLSDYIVVDDSHALLIYPKSDEQEIRDIVAKLSAGTNH